MTLDTTDSQPQKLRFTGRAGRGFAARGFAALVLAPVLLLLVAAPFAVRTRWFALGANDHWVQVLDYPYQVTGADADVVIFGDSAALYGIDPRILLKDTGVRAVNLGGSINSLGVMGDKPLASYLSRNRTPRLIVVYLAPWDTGMPPQYAWPEGIIMMLRHDTGSNILRYAMQHPLGSLNADTFLAELVMHRLLNPSSRDSYAAFQQQASGFLAYPDTVRVWHAGCTIEPQHSVPPDAGAYARELVSRWQTPQTRVVLYVAPVPDCRGADQFTRMQLSPPSIAPQALLPPEYFIDDDFQVHVIPAQVPLSTRLLEQAINKLEPAK